MCSLGTAETLGRRGQPNLQGLESIFVYFAPLWAHDAILHTRTGNKTFPGLLSLQACCTTTSNSTNHKIERALLADRTYVQVLYSAAPRFARMKTRMHLHAHTSGGEVSLCSPDKTHHFSLGAPNAAPLTPTFAKRSDKSS